MQPVNMFWKHKVIRCLPAFSFKSTVPEGYQASATPYCGDSKQFTQTEKEKSQQNGMEAPCTILCLKFSASGLSAWRLSVREEFIRLTLWPPSLSRTQKSQFQYLRAHLTFRKISLCSKRERVPLHALMASLNRVSSFIICWKNPLLSLLSSLSFVSYKGQIFFCKSLVIK